MGLPIEKLDLTLIINEGIFNLFRFLGRHIFFLGRNKFIIIFNAPRKLNDEAGQGGQGNKITWEPDDNADL